jgi:hypothetical protein
MVSVLVAENTSFFCHWDHQYSFLPENPREAKLAAYTPSLQEEVTVVTLPHSRHHLSKCHHACELEHQTTCKCPHSKHRSESALGYCYHPLQTPQSSSYQDSLHPRTWSQCPCEHAHILVTGPAAILLACHSFCCCDHFQTPDLEWNSKLVLLVLHLKTYSHCNARRNTPCSGVKASVCARAPGTTHLP